MSTASRPIGVPSLRTFGSASDAKICGGELAGMARKPPTLITCAGSDGDGQREPAWLR